MMTVETPTDDPLAETSPKLTRGVGALVIELLTETDLDYGAVLAVVHKTLPDARTTVRSIASVASRARKKGETVTSRRRPAALAQAKKVRGEIGTAASTLLVE